MDSWTDDWINAHTSPRLASVMVMVFAGDSRTQENR